VAGSARMHVLQAVRQLYEVVDGKAWGVTEQRMSRVVVIGRRLDKAKLLSSLREACCLAAHAHADCQLEGCAHAHG
jgi:G3E family GTPase